MLRLLMTCALIFVPAGTAIRASDQPAQRNGDLEAARRAGVVVRTRFALAAQNKNCRPWDNLYGYNLLLKQSSDEQRQILRAAEAEGRQSGEADASAANPHRSCAAAVNQIDQADNQLLVLAEHAAEANSH